MKNNIRWVSNRSSILTSVPALVILLALCAAAGIARIWAAAAVLLLIFLLAGAARLWSVLALRKVSLTAGGGADGVFPGEKLEFHIRVHNGKLLPLMWLEIFFPLSDSLCLTPEETREPDQWELEALKEEGCSESLVGEKKMSWCAWYETLDTTSVWTARCRGIYSTSCWRLRTGDAFGLTQVERPVAPEHAGEIAVYPELVPVSVRLFMRNLWNADTGTRGVMEDTTVIRSTREYLPSDSLKHINWRLAARDLPLSVNVYEDILPRSVHFLLDGESFGGEEPHREELEQALSVLASVIVELEQNQVACGLSLCRGAGAAVHLAPGGDVRPLLRALAAYQPAAPALEEETNRVIRQRAGFDLDPLIESARNTGRFYYLTYDCSDLPDQPVLQYLDSTRLTILTWQPGKPFGDYETVCAQTVRVRGERYA
ncbi:MAG: DUF58 domain-containing protein [Oscillospiraceae bacterium]|nr:DUF58 domain-containing protein [Oscillospiraceae bacterium]